MKPICVALSFALAMHATGTLARAQAGKGAANTPNCALEAQRSVAHRNRLPAGDATALSLRIYASPALATEADNLFDACVRRRAGLR
jgi:hypothetical protein